jgi:hypothetical protein
MRHMPSFMHLMHSWIVATKAHRQTHNFLCVLRDKTSLSTCALPETFTGFALNSHYSIPKLLHSVHTTRWEPESPVPEKWQDHRALALMGTRIARTGEVAGPQSTRPDGNQNRPHRRSGRTTGHLPWWELESPISEMSQDHRVLVLMGTRITLSEKWQDHRALVLMGTRIAHTREVAGPQGTRPDGN